MNKENTANINLDSPICPLPLRPKDRIILGHGSGGKLTNDLVEKIFKPHFLNPALEKNNDFADVRILQSQSTGRIVISTDAHIVSPIFFPGGDIGRLAVCGTVNDIAMSGGIPLFLSASFIIEEGLEMSILRQVAQSMNAAAKEAMVEIVAGDTKVAEKGKADHLFISTTGIGWVSEEIQIGGEKAQVGDTIIITGSIGDHGIAVLAQRGELGFRTSIKSDVAPLNGLISSLLKEVPDIHVLRDPTRGGLATTLNEIANQSHVDILINEKDIPIKQEVQAVCEILGFDPLYVANEGKAIVIIPDEKSRKALQILKEHPYGREAKIIGNVIAKSEKPRVKIRTRIGTSRIIDTLSGELLPRIC